MNHKEPWKDPRTPWKTKAAFMSYLRGGFRKIWNTHPTKLAVVKNSRKKIPNPNPRGNRKEVWGFTCGVCGVTDVIKNSRVDHIDAAGKLRDIPDIQGFLERLMVVVEEDLRLICDDCNQLFAVMDRKGITFSQAKIEKQAIQFSKQPIEKQLATLESLGHNGPSVSNAKKRREVYRNHIGGKNGKD